MAVPHPRLKPIATRASFVPTVTGREYLPVAFGKPRADLFVTVARRRTERIFTAPSIQELSAFLWHSARTQGAWTNDFGERREWRPVPSAGACHPHDLMLIRRHSGRWQTSMYNPRSHALERVGCKLAELIALVKEADAAVSIRGATLLFIVGHPDRTARYYTASESLLWRDSGALLGVMSVVAAGLRLAFCPLGMTGEPYISRLLGSRGQALGFGGALIGRSPVHRLASS